MNYLKPFKRFYVESGQRRVHLFTRMRDNRKTSHGFGLMHAHDI